MRMKMGSDDNLPMGAPHLCVFRGVEHFEPDPKKSKYDYGPGWVWKFECVEGPQKGRFGTRVTGKAPTPKSACGKLLSLLVGRPLDKDTEVDLDQYVGKRFMVSMESTESGGTRVANFYAADGGAALPAATLPPTPPSGSSSASSPPPPPPRQPTPPPQRFWVALATGQQATLESREDIQQWITEMHADPTQVDVCKEGEQVWKPASDFGFQGSELPY